MSIQVTVGSYWLGDIAPWGELGWSHLADGGCGEASWKMDLPERHAHPGLRRGQPVRIKSGPSNLWTGQLSEPNTDGEGTFTAKGLHKVLREDALAFDAVGNTTSIPDVAVDRAIARGFPVTRPASLSATAFAAAGSTEPLNYVGALLDAWATSTSKRWGVDANGEVYAAADPTTPRWHLTPGAGRFGLADDEYASDLYIRYVASGLGYATAAVADTVARAAFGRREIGVDATRQGLLTSGQATAVGTGLFAKGAAKQGWTNSLVVSKFQMTTPGGTPASLPLVRGGQLVRMFGVLNEQGQPTNYVDWVIGESKHQAGTASIELAPVGMAARSMLEVIADQYGDAAFAAVQ